MPQLLKACETVFLKSIDALKQGVYTIAFNQCSGLTEVKNIYFCKEQFHQTLEKLILILKFQRITTYCWSQYPILDTRISSVLLLRHARTTPPDF